VSEQLLVGQAVDLDLEGASPPVRVTAVVAGMPPREILLSLAAGLAAPPGLQPGAQVTVSFATNQGLNQGRTTVLRVASARTVSVALARFGDVITSNRRQYFRVAASVVVKLTMISSHAASATKEDAKALTLDVSGGGMRIDTILPLEVNDLVQLTVEVPRSLRKNLPPEMSCEAKVVRVEQVVRRGGRKVHCAGVQYQLKSESERDRWVQLTFGLQRGAF
jgi:hypothetical protein